VCGKSPASTFPEPRGAYAPRSWLHPRVSSRMRGCALQRRFVCHGGLTPPALVLRCECLPTKKRVLRCTNAHPVKSGGREPAVVRKRRLQLQCDEFPCFAFACAECTPRGAYAPRSCIAVRMSAGEKASFAMHERTFAGAAGVSSWPETVANSAGTPQTSAWCASGRFSMLAAIPRGAEFRNPRCVVCIRTVFDVRRKAPAKKP
jgi:hypothetical protein